MTPTATLHLGDCLDLMGRIPDGSVDLIAADLPYGTTACKWDTVIPFAPLWAHYRRILKPRGAVVLTASQPFTSALVMSNPGWLKYCWVWEKTKATGFQDVKHRPLKAHEDVCMFSPAGCSTGSNPSMRYAPQGLRGCAIRRSEKRAGGFFRSDCRGGGLQTQTNWPRSVLRFPSVGKPVHSTQKPVALFEYLIRTYSNPCDLVLDNTMGSGTTLIACLNTGRRGIGIEKDPEIFQTAQRRVNDREAELSELLIPA